LDKKFGWATFWAIFSQTHLVTLLKCQQKSVEILSLWPGLKFEKL
jgi:hypothetical protein